MHLPRASEASLRKFLLDLRVLQDEDLEIAPPKAASASPADMWAADMKQLAQVKTLVRSRESLARSSCFTILVVVKCQQQCMCAARVCLQPSAVRHKRQLAGTPYCL